MSDSTKSTPQNIPANKPALILVHGFRGSPIGLATVADYLRQAGYSVYTPAVPPFAGAPKLDQYTPESYAAFLADYIKSQALDRPVLIGHSMGSIVVAAALSLYPQLVHNKAVLLSPIAERPAPPFRLVAPLSGLLPRRIVDYVTTRYLFIPHDRNLLKQVLEITGECSSDHIPPKSEILNSASFSTHFAVNHFTPSQQILLLAGAKDRLVSQKQTLKLSQTLNAEVEFIPDCGHLHNYEKPQETANAIIKFLEK